MKKILFIVVLTFISTISVKAVSYNDINNLLTEYETNAFMETHPVGSIYITTNNDENTAAKMISKYGGEWETYGNGRVLKSSTTAGTTGGNNTVTLTSDQMPTLNFSGTATGKSITSDSTGSGYTLNYNTTRSAATVSSWSGSHSHTENAYLWANQPPTNSGYSIAYINRYTSGGMYMTVRTQGGGMRASLNTNSTTVTVSGQSATYQKLTGITGIPSHTHTLTIPTLNINGSYTNNNQQSINVEDKYITTYMYKRIA